MSMSAIFRWRTKLTHLSSRITSISLQPTSSSSSHYHSSLNAPLVAYSPTLFHHRQPVLGLWFQERHKWDGKSSGDIDQIPAQVNCPRCTKLMVVLFSTRPLSITGGETGVYQALNLCPNCRTAFYFRPSKLVPLQGSFIEIGRVKKDDDENGGRVGARIWEKLRSYGGDGAERGGGEDKRPVESPVEVKTEGSSESGGGVGFGERNGWGGAKMGKDLPTAKQICRQLDQRFWVQEIFAQRSLSELLGSQVLNDRLFGNKPNGNSGFFF